ncbi:MAG: glyoxylate/hydroxypyruvate reductase A [Burkholderiaceae bacterium]
MLYPSGMKPRIAITVPYPDYARQWRDEVATYLPEAEIFIDEGGTAVADYAIGWKPPADFFERVTGLRAFLSAAAGVDHLLAHPGMPADLPIARIEDGGMAVQMTEYCCAELFRYAQRRGQYEEQQAQGVWKQRGYTPRRDITVGMFGIGVLGHRIATAIRGFGYSVIAAAGSNRVEDGIEVLGPDRRDDFFARARVLILVAPLTEATRGIINRETLGRMPRKSWLINVARGGLVVEPDLIAAIDSGQLLGASLDVFETEPLPAGHPFWTHPGVRITPHVAAITLPDQGAAQLAAKIRRWMAGEPVSGQVRRDRGY